MPWVVIETWEHLCKVGGPATIVVGPFSDEDAAQQYMTWMERFTDPECHERILSMGRCQMIGPTPEYLEAMN